MSAKIFAAAQARILEIWQYTEEKWGEQQADSYVRGLVAFVHEAAHKRESWRAAKDAKQKGVFFLRYRHHYIFFRELSQGRIGVVSILHESMDLPARLKEDASKPEPGN